MRTFFLAIVTALLSIAPLIPHSAPVATPRGVLLPMAQCRFEDGSGPQRFPCVWDAKHMGNGRGSSFVLTAPLDQAPAIPVR